MNLASRKSHDSLIQSEMCTLKFVLFNLGFFICFFYLRTPNVGTFNLSFFKICVCFILALFMSALCKSVIVFICAHVLRVRTVN